MLITIKLLFNDSSYELLFRFIDMIKVRQMRYCLGIVDNKDATVAAVSSDATVVLHKIDAEPSLWAHITEDDIIKEIRAQCYRKILQPVPVKTSSLYIINAPMTADIATILDDAHKIMLAGGAGEEDLLFTNLVIMSLGRCVLDLHDKTVHEPDREIVEEHLLTILICHSENVKATIIDEEGRNMRARARTNDR
jgi:hypothetical protein